MQDDQLAVRLERLESRIAIERLASDYCHGFDKRDEDCFMSIWWENCIWDIGPPFGRFEGHAGIRAALHDALWPAWTMSQHVASNVVIEFQTSVRATMRCDVDCTGLLAGSSAATFVGASYQDEVEKREGSWKIQRRTVTIHYFNSFENTTLSKP